MTLDQSTIRYIGEPLSGFDTAILSAVPTIGHIGSLALDLLITHHSLPQLGYLESQVIPSLCGYEMTQLKTSLEVYGWQNRLVIHQRAPASPQDTSSFYETLGQWLQSVGVTRVLVLASIDASRLEKMDSSRVVELTCDESSNESIPIGKIYGGGSLRKCLRLIHKNIPDTKGVAIYAIEGDNRVEAQSLANRITESLGLAPVSVWHEPSSWERVYGPAVPRALFM